MDPMRLDVTAEKAQAAAAFADLIHQLETMEAAAGAAGKAIDRIGSGPGLGTATEKVKALETEVAGIGKKAEGSGTEMGEMAAAAERAADRSAAAIKRVGDEADKTKGQFSQLIDKLAAPATAAAVLSGTSAMLQGFQKQAEDIRDAQSNFSQMKVGDDQTLLTLERNLKLTGQGNRGLQTARDLRNRFAGDTTTDAAQATSMLTALFNVGIDPRDDKGYAAAVQFGRAGAALNLRPEDTEPTARLMTALGFTSADQVAQFMAMEGAAYRKSPMSDFSKFIGGQINSIPLAMQQGGNFPQLLSEYTAATHFAATSRRASQFQNMMDLMAQPGGKRAQEFFLGEAARLGYVTAGAPHEEQQRQLDAMNLDQRVQILRDMVGRANTPQEQARIRRGFGGLPARTMALLMMESTQAQGAQKDVLDAVSRAKGGDIDAEYEGLKAQSPAKSVESANTILNTGVGAASPGVQMADRLQRESAQLADAMKVKLGGYSGNKWADRIATGPRNFIRSLPIIGGYVDDPDKVWKQTVEILHARQEAVKFYRGMSAEERAANPQMLAALNTLEQLNDDPSIFGDDTNALNQAERDIGEVVARVEDFRLQNPNAARTPGRPRVNPNRPGDEDFGSLNQWLTPKMREAGGFIDEDQIPDTSGAPLTRPAPRGPSHPATQPAVRDGGHASAGDVHHHYNQTYSTTHIANQWDVGGDDDDFEIPGPLQGWVG